VTFNYPVRRLVNSNVLWPSLALISGQNNEHNLIDTTQYPNKMVVQLPYYPVDCTSYSKPQDSEFNGVA